MPLTVAVGNVISQEGFTLLMSPAVAESIWKALLGQGAIPMGSNAWETLRILQGCVILELVFWIFIITLLLHCSCSILTSHVAHLFLVDVNLFQYLASFIMFPGLLTF